MNLNLFGQFVKVCLSTTLELLRKIILSNNVTMFNR